MIKIPISIGIVTLKQRRLGLIKLLNTLKIVVEKHESEIEIVITNNSGADARETILESIKISGIESMCPVLLIDSPKNNIATGRNLLLDNSRYNHLAFLDDDEHPCEAWLEELLKVSNSRQAAAVAGPVPAIFHDTAPRWVHTVDLHNTSGKINAAEIEMTGTGNVLIDKRKIANLRFDESFGKSGGSDTDFFLRLRELGEKIYWAQHAIAFEDIPQSRSTANYLIHRFIKQGENYRKIAFQRGLYSSKALFTVRSLGMVFMSLPIAGLMIIVRSKKSGFWMKRAFSNYGKIHSPKHDLYHKL